MCDMWLHDDCFLVYHLISSLTCYLLTCGLRLLGGVGPRWLVWVSHCTLSWLLTPCCVNSDSARLCNGWDHLWCCIPKCSLGYELLCAVGICEPHIERGWPSLLRHGCVWWVSQERINMSAVPMASRVFFQLLHPDPASPALSEQCE